MKNPMRSRAALPAAMVALGLTLSACGQGDSGDAAQSETSSPAAAVKVENPLVATYDGGLYVIDPGTLKVVEDIPLTGFNRVNPAGDGRHVLVSTSTGFRIMDAAAARLTDDEFAAPSPATSSATRARPSCSPTAPAR